MLNQCFNPKCRRPLHYLREGRVFVFGVQDSSKAEDGDGSRLEHYWLCGACAEHYQLAHSEAGIHMVTRKRHTHKIEIDLPRPSQALAS